MISGKIITAIVGCLATCIAVTAGIDSANAAYPTQPIYKVSSNPIGATPFHAEYISAGRTRLWVVEQAVLPKFIITCTRAEGTNTNNKLEETGKGKAEITFTGCNAFAASLNSNNLYREGGQLSCNVKTGNENAGTIKTTQLNTTLVWNDTMVVADRRILDLLESQTGQDFAEIKLENVTPNSCGPAGTYKLKGGVLAAVSHGSENEQVPVLLLTLNGSSKIVPLYKNWRVKIGVEADKTGVGELKLEKTTGTVEMLNTALAGVATLEIAQSGGLRPDFGIFE
jgi:hypothetical protein